MDENTTLAAVQETREIHARGISLDLEKYFITGQEGRAVQELYSLD